MQETSCNIRSINLPTCRYVFFYVKRNGEWDMSIYECSTYTYTKNRYVYPSHPSICSLILLHIPNSWLPVASIPCLKQVVLTQSICLDPKTSIWSFTFQKLGKNCKKDMEIMKILVQKMMKSNEILYLFGTWKEIIGCGMATVTLRPKGWPVPRVRAPVEDPVENAKNLDPPGSYQLRRGWDKPGRQM